MIFIYTIKVDNLLHIVWIAFTDKRNTKTNPCTIQVQMFDHPCLYLRKHLSFRWKSPLCPAMTMFLV